MPTIKKAKAEFAAEFEELVLKIEALCEKHGVTFLDRSGVEYGRIPNQLVLGDEYWDSSRC